MSQTENMSDDQTQVEDPQPMLSLNVGKPGSGFVFKFFQFGDLFRQRIEWTNDGNAVPLLEDFRWDEASQQNQFVNGPTAPTQQVVKESHDGNEVVMSIGLSGKSHWSASYRADSQTNPDHCRVVVEHACRLNDTEQELSCRFWLGEIEATQPGEQWVHLDGGGHQWQLQALDGTLFEIDADSRMLIVRPCSISDSRPTTVPWGWSITTRA